MGIEGILNPMGQGRFVIRTGHSLTEGKVVSYVMVGAPAPFTVTASREGIVIRGQLGVGVDGIDVLRDILARAAKHHTHLKSFAVGEPQTILDETALFNESLQEQQMPTTTQ